MSEWQPIETAPKDVIEMFVIRAFNVTSPSGHVKNYTSDPFCVSGFSARDDGDWDGWPHSFRPTHWLRLPPPPEPQQ